MALIIQTKIPKEQKEIIRQALINLENQIELINKLNTQSIEDNFIKHDLHVLKSLLAYDIIVQLAPKQKENFTFKEGIDFPEWTE